jgi:ubiquitin C-terminal hydrolase
MPNDYYDYKLRGIVVHYGSAEAGHYYSYIKDEKKQWHEFND